MDKSLLVTSLMTWDFCDKIGIEFSSHSPTFCHVRANCLVISVPVLLSRLPDFPGFSGHPIIARVLFLERTNGIDPITKVTSLIRLFVASVLFSQEFEGCPHRVG
jgi:hypothetical protein